MISSILGQLAFDTGWKAKSSVNLFGKSFGIVIKAKAYYEKDGITEKQTNAFADYAEKKESLFEIVERLLSSSFGDAASSRFTPKTLLFERDGSYALLLDDNDDPDDGIAVLLSPTEKIISQDEYL